MSILSQHYNLNMSSSGNLFHSAPASTTSSESKTMNAATTTTSNHNHTHNQNHNHNHSINRKRSFLEDCDSVPKDSKRPKTAPPSPPLTAVYRTRSLSSSSSAPSSLASFSLSSPTKAHFPKSPKSPDTNLVNIASTSTASSSSSSTSYKYLNQANYQESCHSLNYPDTCITDNDWRFNLEIWIEKHFPEKFMNLKNLLKNDKPGFELLNDAILLTELKEQLDKRSLKPQFNSKISKKMVANPFYTSFNAASLSSSHLAGHSGSNRNNISNYTYNSSNSNNNSGINSNSSKPISLPPITSLPIVNLPSMKTFSYSPPQQPKAQMNYSCYQAGQASPVSFNANMGLNLHTPQSLKPELKENHSSSPSSSNSGNNSNSKSFMHSHPHKSSTHSYTIHHHNYHKKKCISCGSDQSPCWRPSWASHEGQLCNSCGLRYKKTGARCINKACRRIPAKGEWTAMKSRGKVLIKRDNGEQVLGYTCLHCDGEVETKEM